MQIPLKDYADFYASLQSIENQSGWQMVYQVDQTKDYPQGPFRNIQNLIDQGQYLEAQEALSPLLADEAHHPRAHFYMGIVHGYLGAHETAQVFFKQAAALGHEE